MITCSFIHYLSKHIQIHVLCILTGLGVGDRLLMGADVGQCLQHITTDGKTTLGAGNPLPCWV